MRSSRRAKDDPACVDRRYPHFLQPVSSGQPIVNVLAFGCSGIVTAKEASLGVATESLTQWSAVSLVRHMGVWSTVSEFLGVTQDEFWHVVSDMMRSHGPLHIVCYGAERCWPLIGLWSELSSGRVRIAGPSRQIPLDGRDPGRTVQAGFLCTDGPPSVAQIRIGDRPGYGIMLDVRNYGVTLPDWPVGATQDAEVAASAFVACESLAREQLGVNLGLTASSTANRVWRCEPFRASVHCHVDPVAARLERDAYVGGRCEAYRLGVLPGEWWVFDIRSCYGSIMLKYDLPCGLVDSSCASGSLYLRDMAVAGLAIARVVVDTPSPDYPVQIGDMVIYPIGRFTTTLAGSELAHAFMHGRVMSVQEAAYYRMAPCLSDFAAAVYAANDVADIPNDSPVKGFTKAMLVAMAGRLGQSTRWWQTNNRAVAPALWGEWQILADDGRIVHRRAIAGVVQDLVTGGWAPEAVPAIAVWIQAYARARLRNAIEVCGRDHVAYVDTDCVIVDRTGCARMHESGLLGDGPVGDWTYRSGPGKLEIRGIKYYLHGDEIRCAGKPRGLHVRHPGSDHQWYLPSLSSRVSREHNPDYPLWIDSLPPASEYRHGVVSADGVVTPIRLEERE